VNSQDLLKAGFSRQEIKDYYTPQLQKAGFNSDEIGSYFNEELGEDEPDIREVAPDKPKEADEPQYTKEEIDRRSDQFGSLSEPSIDRRSKQYGSLSEPDYGKPKDGLSPVSGIKELGESLWHTPENIASSSIKAAKGWRGASVLDDDAGSKIIRDTAEKNFIRSRNAREKYGKEKMAPGIKVTEATDLGQNLGFSGVSMIAGGGTGVATAAAAGPIAGWAAGTAAAGASAYRMASYDFMQGYLESVQEEKGAPLTRDEEAKLKTEFSDKAKQYGLWEAIPEAVGQATGLGIIAIPLKKMVGGRLATKILAKMAGVYGVELGTEAFTQQGQSGLEPGGTPRSMLSLSDWISSIKEVAPQTVLLTTITAGLAGLGVAGYNRFKNVREDSTDIKNALADVSTDETVSPEEKEYVDWWAREIDKAEAEKGPMGEWAATTPQYLDEEGVGRLEAQQDIGQEKLKKRLAEQETKPIPEMPVSEMVSKRDQILKDSDLTPDDINQAIIDKQADKFETGELETPSDVRRQAPNVLEMSGSQKIEFRKEYGNDTLAVLTKAQQEEEVITLDDAIQEGKVRAEERKRKKNKYFSPEETAKRDAEEVLDESTTVPDDALSADGRKLNKPIQAKEKTEAEAPDLGIEPTALAAFPEMSENNAGGYSISRFAPHEVDSMRSAGIVYKNDEGEDVVNAEAMWQQRDVFQRRPLKEQGRLLSKSKEKMFDSPKKPWEMTEKEYTDQRNDPTKKLGHDVLYINGVEVIQNPTGADSRAISKEAKELPQVKQPSTKKAPSKPESIARPHEMTLIQYEDSLRDKVVAKSKNITKARYGELHKRGWKTEEYKNDILRAASEGVVFTTQQLDNYTRSLGKDFVLKRLGHDYPASIPEGYITPETRTDIKKEHKFATVKQPSTKKAKAQPVSEKWDKPYGYVWIKEKQRPFTEYREIKRGKNKGRIVVTISGKGHLVDKSKVAEWPAEKVAVEKVGIEGYKAWFDTEDQARKAMKSMIAGGIPVDRVAQAYHSESGDFKYKIYRTQKEVDEGWEKHKKAGAEKKALDLRKTEEAKAERDADDFNGFISEMTPLKKGRIRRALEKLHRFDGKVMSVRDRVEQLNTDGDLEASTTEENKIKPMSRTQYNRATNEEQAAHEKKMREAGMKTVYLVNDTDMGKIGYDYAEHLLGATTPEKAVKPALIKNIPSDEIVEDGARYRRDIEGEPKNLYVAHNLTQENLYHALELGGHAAPSLAVGRTDSSPLTGFGEITLLGPPDMLFSSKTNAFDADIYSPRHPRATVTLDKDKFNEFVSNLGKTYGLRIPQVGEGIENLGHNEAVKLAWLRAQGINIPIKKSKVDSLTRKVATIMTESGNSDYVLEQDPKVIKLVERKVSSRFDSMDDALKGALLDGRSKEEYISDTRHIREILSDARRHIRSQGYDTYAIGDAVIKKMRNPKLSVAYDRYIRDTFNDLVKDKKLFKGFTDSGYRKYSPYTLENIVKEMTKKLRGGEGFDYGPGSIRSAYAKRFKNIKEIQKARDRIVTDKEMDAIREESSDKLVNLLDELRPSYKFDGDSFGYMDDASSAIAEGSRGLREAFDLTPEMRGKVDEYIDYLRKLPTEYFEAKMQRAVDLSEFTAAVVPKGTEQKLVDTLEGKGVAVSYYKKGDDADRLSAVQKAGAKQDILFRKSPAKGPTSPESITESIQPILDTWKAHPRVEVVKSVDELPGPLIDIIQRKTDGEIDGVFYNDRVYLIADNISSVAQAEKTILHETLGHWGTRKTFGRSFDRFLRSVMKDAKKGDIEAISKAYGLDLTKPLDRLEAADEYVARIAESGKDAATWAKLTSYVKQWLIKHGFTVKLSDNEIRAIVKRGVEAKEGKQVDDNIRFMKRRKPAPRKTLTTYKMFRTLKGRPGELFPLFIGKTESIPMNEWMDSEYIPTKGFAQRPGWHVGRKPRADHLMKKDGTMAEDRVWAEVEISADKDWQDVADQNKTRDIPGQVPADGFYKFKRPSNQGGEWLIAGSMRVNRTLTADDVEAINTEDAYQARFRKVKESDGRKIKTLYHGSKVGLYGEKIEGGLGSGNIYGGVFASTSESKARVHGDIVYKTDIPENDILTISNIRNDIEPKILKKALKENLPYSTPKQLNTAYEIVIEEESEYGDKYDEADLLDIFSSSDIGEAGWEAQRLRGLVAKSLGYKAVEVSDEYGTSYLILPGVKTEKLPTEDAYQARFHKIADLAKAGDVEGVRAESKKSYDEMMTPTDGNPLDAGAIAYLKSGDIETYFDHMPWIGELKPNEILKHDSSTGKLIATITGKDGKLRPSIRQSGFFAIKEFQDYFEQPHIKDISKTEWSKADAYRLFQAIDNGIFGGPAAKNIQWANQKTSMAKLLYSDQYKTKLADIQDKYLKTKKENELAGDISEFVSTELADVDAEEVYDIPKVKSFLKTAKEGRALDIIRAAQEIRTMWDSLISEQNRARKLRKQDEIGYLENYRPWVMKSNIFKRLMGIKAKPGHITDQPEMPDFIQPNKPFNPREIERTGGLESYSKERDIIKLMSDYIDTASKDIFDTNIIHSNKIYAATLRNIGHSNSAEAIERLTAEVFAGVSPRLTKVFRETAGLSTIRKPILSIRRALMRAVFPFNWTWNMFIQTSSAGLTFSRYGLKANIAGLSYLTDSTVKENTREMAYSLIVKRRWGGKMVYQDVSQDLTSNRKLDGSWLDTVSDFGNFLTSTFEDYLTGHAVQAAFYDGYNRLGLRGRELWEYASEGGAKTQSMYNYQDKPGMLRPQEVGALVPFQTFAFEVYNTVREMNIVPGVSKTGLYRELHAKERGGKPELKRRLIMFGRFTTALMVTNMIVDACIDRKPWGVSSFVPFLGYALGAAGIGDRAGQQPVPFQYVNDFYKGMIAFLKYGNWSRLRKWGIRYHAVGGVQLNRIIEGIIASVNEEVTDVRGKRMYPVTEGKLTAITMGPAKTAAGKEYYDKHYPSTVDKVLEYFNEKSDKRTYRSKRTSQRRTERSKRTQQRSKRTQQRR